MRLRGGRRADCGGLEGATVWAPTPQIRRVGTERDVASAAARPRERRDSRRKRVITRAPEAPRSRRLLIGCGRRRRCRACSWPGAVGAVCCGPGSSLRRFCFPVQDAAPRARDVPRAQQPPRCLPGPAGAGNARGGEGRSPEPGGSTRPGCRARGPAGRTLRPPAGVPGSCSPGRADRAWLGLRPRGRRTSAPSRRPWCP